MIAAHSADTFELAPFLSFPLMPPVTARPPLAKGKVRLVGDIVAVIVAETLAQAVDAAEAVVVDIDPLPAVIDPEAAVAEGAPLLFEEHGSNVVFETGIGLEDGDPLEGAAHVSECRTVSQRLAGVPMETNGCVAIPGDDGQLTVWIPSQNPVAVRDALAAQLGMEAANLRVAAPMVGGGFGPKAGLYTEHVLISELARAIGRPVKWTEGRSENMVSMVHGRGMVMNTRIGLDADGTFVGLDVDVVAEAGAYPGIGAFLPGAHADDEPGRVQLPEDPLPRRVRRDEHDVDGRVPRCRSPGGDADARARHRRRRRRARHRPGRAPPSQLPRRGSRSRSRRSAAPTTTAASTSRHSTPCSRQPTTRRCSPTRRRAGRAAT